MTLATQLVLESLLGDGMAERHGYDIGATCGLASGTVHPILARLETAGWLTSRWEELDEQSAGRPPRRYYRLTGEGVQAAREALAARSHGARLAPVRSASTS